MFLDPPDSAEGAAYLERERASTGYLMDLERAWCWRPDVAEAFQNTRSKLMAGSNLSKREIAVLVCATARAREDAYCSLAWGIRLARLVGPSAAAAVLRGEDSPELNVRERALVKWAEAVVRDPNGTRQPDVDALRAAGFAEREIFEATLFVALRLAFSTVNDALGALPDPQLYAAAPEEVRRAVVYGRHGAEAAL